MAQKNKTPFETNNNFSSKTTSKSTKISPNTWEKFSHSKLLFDIWFLATQESLFLVGSSLVHGSQCVPQS
jgi:hypothetical protein